jgi:hypothetical protein
MDNWKALLVEMEQFDEMISDDLNCELVDLTEKKIGAAGLKKDGLQKWVYFFADMYRKTKKFNVGEMGMKIEELNSKVIENQDKVIALQDQLISSKEEQLAAFQSTVKAEVAGVQTAVQTEIKSWSKAVQQQQSTANTANVQYISPAKIKEAVKSAVEEDDRSRNILIFGKKEEDNETVSDTVTTVFEDLNEKPRVIECRRLGTISQGKCRPIKVKLSSSEAVLHILRNAKTLKTSSSNSNTYLAQDRTKEERAQHKDLVEMVKAKMDSEPGMYHFIRGGAVVSVKKKS